MYDIIILGGGASALYMGMRLEEARIKNYLILEGNDKVGEKLSISGGGKGNLTNKKISPEHYIGQDAEFTRYALEQFSFRIAMNLFEKLEIPLEERSFGQIFSRIPAREIRNAFAYPLNIEHECTIYKVEDSKNKDSFLISTNLGEYEAKRVIIATGSCVYPQLGASDIGLKIAREYDLEYKDFEPALTPLILEKSSPLLGLSGISLDVGIRLNNKYLIRPLLFTHTGLSGPAILLLSCYYNKQEMLVNFMPQANIKEICHDVGNGKLLVKNLLARYMPDRLALALIPEELQNKKVAELSKKEREILENSIHKHDFSHCKRGGFEKAEAARNGILTKELDAKTMQVKKRKNMYVVGEVMDILGHLGGYNLHWAFASAHCAVEAIIEDLNT